MASAGASADAVEGKSTRWPMIIGVLLALVGAGSGFYLVSAGLILHGESKPVTEATLSPSLPDVGFVALEPMVISLGPRSENKHLRFAAQLEVPTASISEVQQILPRVVDVLNSYLRAVETRDIENPASLSKLRAQMLRRIQIVVGEGHVRDLLIMEFVLN
jgi:flagellar protein FliL